MAEEKKYQIKKRMTKAKKQHTSKERSSGKDYFTLFYIPSRDVPFLVDNVETVWNNKKMQN